MRHFAFIPLFALLGTTSAPFASAAQPTALAAAVSDADDICRPFLTSGDDADSGFTTPAGEALSRVPGVAATPPASPTPAPPPPPAAERGGDDSAIVVTGVRAPLQRGVQMKRNSTGYFPSPEPRSNRERYAGKDISPIHAVADTPVSTFAVDVDTGSYSNVRRMILNGALPPQAAVRTEEMLNYFRYDYPAPADRTRPFSITSDVTSTPWNPNTRLLRVGLRGYDLPRTQRPAANLVFLVDVSGSMESMDKLPLVKCSLALLAGQLSDRDRVSIVVYAGAAGLVLPPTSDRAQVIAALSRLEAGGSTAGAEGIRLAYQTARAAMRPDGINRIVLATDGDFNVGVTDDQALIDMVEREREAGITLTTLGFGEGNYNEAMMEQVADHGNGNYAYIDSPREARKVLDQQLSSTLFTIAKDVKIQVEFNPAYVREYRLIGYENRALAEQDFDNDAVDAGDIGAGHQVTALYEIVPAGDRGWLPERRYRANRRQAKGAANGEMAWLRLRYKLPTGSQSRLIERPIAAGLVRDAAAPSGDLAFTAAVAAFGQRLRGDPHLGTFSFVDSARLAQSGAGDYWRREFVELATKAQSITPSAGGSD